MRCSLGPYRFKKADCEKSFADKTKQSQQQYFKGHLPLVDMIVIESREAMSTCGQSGVTFDENSDVY